MDYPLEKLFGCRFFSNWVLIRHHIFWEIGHFLEFHKKGAKKVKTRKVLAKERKRKRKGEHVFFLLPKKKLDTIEDHHNKHTIDNQGCSWTTPLKNCLDAVFLF